MFLLELLGVGGLITRILDRFSMRPDASFASVCSGVISQKPLPHITMANR